ncbi:phosphoserine phosphatase [Lachnospiraceae bacterium]|nr:phosphoserine phosphatase [Lachnospiraceae bacterium]
MSGYAFLFDLDATITRQEILPAISRKLGVYEQMCSLTERTERGELPFQQSFLQRVELLRQVPVSEVRRLVADVPVNERLAEFIRTHRQRCYIATAHLDIWVEELIKKQDIEHHIFCSQASVKDGYMREILSIVDKNAVQNKIGFPCVAVGDGNHDAEMIQAAEIGIGYGGVHKVAPAVLACASHAVYQEDKLVEFLERLL